MGVRVRTHGDMDLVHVMPCLSTEEHLKTVTSDMPVIYCNRGNLRCSVAPTCNTVCP